MRDGGGLQPDSVVKNSNYSDVLYNLVTKNRIFDYATRYRAAHPEAPSIADFALDDAAYADFSDYVLAGNMKYDSSFDALIKELRKQAEDQGYMTEANDSVLKTVERSLGSDLKRDLELKKNEIKTYLEEEIAMRYYGDKGRVAVEIKTDPVVAKAVEILETPAYDAILNKTQAKADNAKKK